MDRIMPTCSRPPDRHIFSPTATPTSLHKTAHTHEFTHASMHARTHAHTQLSLPPSLFLKTKLTFTDKESGKILRSFDSTLAVVDDKSGVPEESVLLWVPLRPVDGVIVS